MPSPDDFPVLNFQDFIFADGDKLTTDSVKVAAVFHKRHDHVLRDIDIILSQVPDSFGKPNFEESENVITNNLGFTVKGRMFGMTKDGFVLLAMGFNGKKALGFKLGYIRAFNDMAAFIKNQRDGLQYRDFEKELERKAKKRRAGAAVASS